MPRLSVADKWWDHACYYHFDLVCTHKRLHMQHEHVCKEAIGKSYTTLLFANLLWSCQ